MESEIRRVNDSGYQLLWMDGCDLTPIYSVCATRDISECGSLNKGLNHQTMNQQTRKFSIKAVTALKLNNLNCHTLCS